MARDIGGMKIKNRKVFTTRSAGKATMKRAAQDKVSISKASTTGIDRQGQARNRSK